MESQWKYDEKDEKNVLVKFMDHLPLKQLTRWRG